MSEPLIRWHQPRDTARIAAILAESFPDENWTGAKVAAFVATRSPQQAPIIRVYEDENRDVCAVLLYTVRPAEVEIYRVATTEYARRQGCAYGLLWSLLRPQSLPLLAEIPADNWVACRLFEKAGFTYDETATATGTDGKQVFTHPGQT